MRTESIVVIDVRSDKKVKVLLAEHDEVTQALLAEGLAPPLDVRILIGGLRPVDYYRGNPAQLHEARRRKLAAARHRRREKNLRLRQPTLPLEPAETVA